MLNLVTYYVMGAKISSNKPLLIMLYGFPGSGKTYFARQLSDSMQAAHLQGDKIRNELFEKPRYDREENAIIAHLMDYMTEEFLSAGISVVYDINAMRMSQRRSLRDMARRAGAVPLLMWQQIDADTAFQRTIKRDRRRADDKFSPVLDKQGFERIAVNMQNPDLNEDPIVTSGKHVFTTQFNSLVKRLRDQKLINLDDSTSHVVKPGLVNLVPKQNVGRVDFSRRNIQIR